MDLILARGELIEICVEKSKTLAKESLDMKDTATKLKKKMLWSSNKFKIGLGLVIAAVLVAVKYNFGYLLQIINGSLSGTTLASRIGRGGSVKGRRKFLTLHIDKFRRLHLS